ncbi:MAG: hypothetical protein J2P20_14725, partial [Pseudonocardia sp.]|nr:hypothetical protein [Pseudonocardia sp.]
MDDHSDTLLAGSLPRPRGGEIEAWPEEPVDLDEDGAEPATASMPRTARRRRHAPRERTRALPVGALTIVLVAGVVAGLIVGATALLGARKSASSDPDQG